VRQTRQTSYKTGIYKSVLFMFFWSLK